MKIGVALSGCDIGGVCASTVLHWMQQEGILIHFISASGTASPAALLFSCGLDAPRSEDCLREFLLQRHETDLDYAIASLATRLAPHPLEEIRKLAVSSLDLSTNRAVCFTNDFAFETDTLRTFPLWEPYEALSASIGTVDGLCSFPFNGCRLCDYSAQYGCPFYPLHLTGCEKVLSFSFEPDISKCPYDILIKRRIADTCRDADFHLTFSFPLSLQKKDEFEACQENVVAALEANKKQIYDAILF